MSWSDMSLDDYGGTKVLLQRLAASPLVRQSIPNASAICNQYFSFARKAHEPMTQFLVREALGFSEFVEALVRLAEEKRGIRQEDKDFGLPAGEADYEQDYDSGWDAWWDDWAEWPQDDVNAPDPENGDFDPNSAQPTTTLPASTSRAESGSPHGGGYQRVPQGTMSSPSRRSAGVQPSLAGEELNELSFADSFVLGVLRGFRLLQAAGLSADERRDILSATHGSLDFDEVNRALQTLWDEQFTGSRSSHPTLFNSNWHELATVEEEEPEAEWHPATWDSCHVSGDGGQEDWSSWDWADAYNVEAYEDKNTTQEENDEDLKEAQKAERMAESLAVEAQRSWAEAQRATAALRKDRGFGQQPPSGGMGKGRGPCFQCGGPHLSRECPDRRHPGPYKGKGKSKWNYLTEYDPYTYDDFFTGKKGGGKKGKNVHWLDAQACTKGKKGKGKSNAPVGRPSVNAYNTEMLFGALDLQAQINETERTVSPSETHGLLDCGATASAGPQIAVEQLISTIVDRDRQAVVSIHKEDRPYFRFGNGKWGQALYRVSLTSAVSGKPHCFELYALPNPPGLHDPSFDRSQLVPILIGMNHLAGPHSSMMVDFATGFALDSHEAHPDIYQLEKNKKGHYMLDIAFFLTRGFTCHDGHPRIHVIEKDTSNMINDHHTLQFMPLELLSQEHARVVHEHDEARLRQSRQQLMTLHDYVCGRRLQLSAAQMHGSQLTEEQGNKIWDIKTAAADFREKITGSREKEPPRPFDPPRGVGPDPRDPRMSPEQWPCYGEHHLGSVRANPHGQWQHCQVCNIRWMYVPRKGSHGQNTKTDAPPLVQRMLGELKVLMNSERPSAETVHAMQKKVDADIVLEDLVHRQISKIQGERNMPEQTGKAVVKSSGYPSTSPATPTSRNKTKGQTSSPSSWEICTPPPTDHFEKDVKQLLNPKEMEQLMQPTRRMHDFIDLFHYALEELYGREAAADGYNAAELYGINNYGLRHRPRRINLQQGYDIYKTATWEHLKGLRRRHRPRRLWFSLPCTKWCQWSKLNYATEERQELLATYRRRERRMLWQAAHFIEDTLNEDPETDIYWEWPWPCEGWNQRPLEYIAHLLQARGREWLPCRVDGCNYGLRADDGAGDFLRKRWMIRTTSSFFHQRFKAKVCPGSHRHAWIQGAETSKSSYYPWRMVKSMALAWRQEYVSDRNMQLIFAKEDKPYMIPIEDEINMERAALQALPALQEQPAGQELLPEGGATSSSTSLTPTSDELKKWKARLAHFHKAAGHPTARNLARLVREATDEIIQALVQGWLGHYPRPKLVVADNAKSFISSKFHDFLQSENIQVHYPPEKEPWGHGTVEAAVADIKHVATAIHQENLNNSPEMTLTLAASALNGTEYTAGYSSHQWAFGTKYSISDEDIRIWNAIEPKEDFLRITKARSEAEEIARRSRARRVLSKLANTTVRQPVRQYAPTELVMVWRKLQAGEQHQGEDPTQWKSLDDMIPKKEYTDLLDEEPGELDQELPDLPAAPDETTLAPIRRAVGKPTLKDSDYKDFKVPDEEYTPSLPDPEPGDDPEPEGTTSLPSSSTRVNDYGENEAPDPKKLKLADAKEPEVKRHRGDHETEYDLKWLDLLREEAQDEITHHDLFAFLESYDGECLSIEIVVDQNSYVEGLTNRLREQDALRPSEVAACRTALGALQWLAVQSQPLLTARCNLLLSEVTTAGTLEHAREIQAMIAECRAQATSLEFVKFDDISHWSEVVFIGMGDQAHNNRSKGESTGGFVILASSPACKAGHVCRMSLLAWRTWRLKRRAVGSNDAEVQAILETEDVLFRCRLL
ncbi:unnamed protein product [Durusdinium trenchii]|uniref:Integrase catalytic domain-containing protein n=1 Tax=Durusdinium trenchii TaxID=1381693 RepID=A0ABP0S0R7_9DINO